ncbi:PIN domain-containing protein [Lichenihabitans sp. Uapishka_5]|uniref:PIN domain-containing protein n=1 Tax=Lichenihabitans sp. Uapishka_5 TaxID=3037302 RepID=UPI0029E7D182|nr:PIN domain-containing protein [Lichenihabitans sp. Uapishka_5]MDX7952663.1 PIN domain-containing protein [Lichenihabitans sp. Uapishka_5]
MFANRFTAFVDACTLAGVLRRNLLLSLAEAEFFRVRWSRPVLDETERAIVKMLTGRQIADSDQRAKRSVAGMEAAFKDAMVADFDAFMGVCEGLPDQGDAHVVAAALKTQAVVIVTENVKHFPPAILKPLNIEARSADDFLADTIALDSGKAVAAVRRMRERFRKPDLSAELLLMNMEANGLTETVDVLRPYAQSL